MAQKGTPDKSRNQKNSKPESKIKQQKKKTGKNDDAEEVEDVIAPSSSTELQNEDVEETSGEDNAMAEEPKGKRKGDKKKNDKKEVKNKGKRKIGKEEEEEKSGNAALYKFPMNRITRIIKSEDSDLKISQEAVFLINRASEKFLQLFCKEAYSYAFMDDKNHIGYKHLSSVVSERRRFDFLSDFVPEKLKAEDALKKMSTADE